VALAWAGNPSHPNDRNRSLDLKLLALEGTSYVSVQRELGRATKNYPRAIRE